MNNNLLKDINSENESDDDSDKCVLNEEELTFNPYNPLNKEININNIVDLLNKYNIFTKPLIWNYIKDHLFINLIQNVLN